MAGIHQRELKVEQRRKDLGGSLEGAGAVAVAKEAVAVPGTRGMPVDGTATRVVIPARVVGGKFVREPACAWLAHVQKIST